MQIILLAYLLFIISVVGCTSRYHGENKVELKQQTSDHVNETYQHEISWAKSKERPKLGLALSGGGSKSSPFVMGVLKQFVDTGWIRDVDIISSVSGGGYSAYYLYSKAIYINKNPDDNLTLDKFFENYEIDELRKIPTFKEYDTLLKNYRENVDSYDHGKYQAYTKSYQDILSWFQSEQERGADYSDDIRSFFIAGESLLESLATLPFHHVANTLFDWKLEMVPSQYKYKHGIIRAYGENKYLDNEVGKETFEDLKIITDGNEVPLWIINASNFEEYWWKTAGKKNDQDFSNSIFEITPYGFGSGKHSYRLESPTKLSLDLPRSVLASAAFFDALGDSEHQGAIFLLLHTINSRWGIKIPNYNSSSSQQWLHDLFPFPFYYLDSQRSKITLADGGQSGDNLGLYSLVKRGVENIVVVDAAGDGENSTHTLKMEDMCRVSKYLRTKQLSVVYEGSPKDKNDYKILDYYDNFCIEDDSNQKIVLSYYKWEKPIWKGYIQDKNGNIVTHLYFIKAAIDKDNLTENANAFNQNICNEDNCPKSKCTADGKYCSKSDKYRYSYPSSLLYFWINGNRGNSTANFPQTSTVIDTLNASQTLYQAYFDLGFYTSQYLDIDDDFLKIFIQ